MKKQFKVYAGENTPENLIALFMKLTNGYLSVGTIGYFQSLFYAKEEYDESKAPEFIVKDIEQAKQKAMDDMKKIKFVGKKPF